MLSSIPVDKNRNRGLILALLAGIISGASMAVWLDKIEQRFRDLQELKQMIPLPILGLIPKAQGQVSVFKNSQSGLVNKSNAFTEAIRSLALSLSLQTSHRMGQVIAIAAATTGEGTTTMTCNLGRVLAELGKRVLIVDANLADPKIHQVFSLSNSQGLSTAIATDLTWQSLVQSTAPQETEESSYTGNNLVFSPENSTNGSRSNSNGLSSSVLTKASVLTMAGTPPVHQGYPDVLTAGPEITSSFLWLVSPKMNLMLEQWRQVYDYILIDTSAISELADAQSIIPKVDEVALVVDLKRAERAIVLDTLENLRTNQSRITGIIVNNVD
jgi:Mrp family chromosome partitioning ATPase